VHWYLSAIIHQDKDFNITKDQSRYTKSTVTRFLDAAGITKNNMQHGIILPNTYVFTSKDIVTKSKESCKLQEVYNMEFASCIGPLIYLSYTRSGISFAVNKLAKNSRQPIEKPMMVIINLLRYIKQYTQLGLAYYSAVTKSPVYQLLQENIITLSRHVFPFCYSSRDVYYDTSSSTGAFYIFYQGGIVDNSRNMPEPVATSIIKDA
jgi:hypothetical protein